MTYLDNKSCETCRWWGGERGKARGYPYETCRIFPPKLGKKIVLPYHDPDNPNLPGPLVTLGI